MARRIPRRQFLASLGAAAATTGASSLSLGPAGLAAGYMAVSAKPKAAPIFQAKALKGVDFVLHNSPTSRKYLVETMPGGVDLLDYNNDGLLDIFFVNGGHATSPMSVPEKFDPQNPRYWNRLYRQNKDGSFTDVTQSAGLADAADGNYGMGVAVGD